jgi:hypothetical protein
LDEFLRGGKIKQENDGIVERKEKRKDRGICGIRKSTNYC